MRAARLVTAVAPTRSAAYDLVLLAHVLAVVAAFGAVVVAGACAAALTRTRPLPEGVVRYYRPGVNWAGRVLHLVPVLGIVLVALSHGAWSFSDGWVLGGLVLWVVADALAETLLWPAERRIQQVMAGCAPGPQHEEREVSSGRAALSGLARPPGELAMLGRRAASVAGLVAAVLVGTSVLMVAKP